MPDPKVNILMIDDQPAKLLTYEAILGELGENLIKATSPTEALSILLKTDIAVVLMDVSMPDLDGFELADLIRQHPRYQDTAIIFISGVHLADEDKIHGYRRGAVDYISVPVVPDVLRAKISIFVDLHRKTRTLEKLNNELERRVIERTEELRSRAELLDLATEAIITREFPGGAICFWNEGAGNLYGWRREEVLGKDIHNLLCTSFPVSREDVESSLRTRRLWEGNLRQRTKDGTEIIVACRKTLNDEGDTVLEVIRDATAQIRAEEVLRETEKLAAMGRVAGIIAHEINNPLAAITNLFYLLRNNPSLNEEGRRIADLAEEELKRVSHITRQTLTFYREAKAPMSVSVVDLLEDVIGVQEVLLQNARICIEKKYFSAGAVHGFPGELRQIFLNLVANAIEAMPNGGKLRLTVREGFDWTTDRYGISVLITDTGVGIKRQDARKLFEPFFSTKSIKGTGLGLWISRGIVQKYDGRISFRSYCPGPDALTSFRVFFPGSGALNLPVVQGDTISSVSDELNLDAQEAGSLRPQVSPSDRNEKRISQSLLKSA
jgi:PAS domain S-box-containing protein